METAFKEDSAKSYFLYLYDMCYFMRALLTLILTFILTAAFSQIRYDANVIQQYDSIYKSLPRKFKDAVKKLEQDKSYFGGLAVTQFFIDDTLNKIDLEPKDTHLKILDANGASRKTVPEPMSDLLVMLAAGSITSDTLNIRVTPWFFSNQTIEHKIFGSNIQTFYNECYKYDSILRANNTDVSTNNLTIPVATIKFVLSGKYSSDELIYGQAEIVTNDFFYLAAYGFKNETLKHRFHIKYYFKLRPKNNR